MLPASIKTTFDHENSNLARGPLVPMTWQRSRQGEDGAEDLQLNFAKLWPSDQISGGSAHKKLQPQLLSRDDFMH